MVAYWGIQTWAREEIKRGLTLHSLTIRMFNMGIGAENLAKICMTGHKDVFGMEE